MPPIQQTLRYAVAIAFFPFRTTDRMLEDPDRLRHAVVAWLSLGIAYGLVAFVGGLRGFGPVIEPSLPVPAESYYLWMGPLTPALYLLNFIVLAGLAHLLSRCAGGAGTFDDAFAIASLTFFLPIVATMWVWEAPVLLFFPELRREELGGLGYLPEWLDLGRQVVGLAWIFGVLVASLSRAQRLSLARCFAVTLLAFLPAWLVTLTYLR